MRRSFAAKFCVGLVPFGLSVTGCAPPAAPPSAPPPPAAERAIFALAAPAAAAPSQSDPNVVARVGTRPITKDQMLAPMIETNGLPILLHLAQLELAKQTAAQKGVKVSPEDMKQERKLTFDRMFKESDDQLREKLREAEAAGKADDAAKIKEQLNVDREALLDQYLAQQFVQTRQYISRAEWDLVMETNVYLRKIAEADPNMVKAIPEETLRKAFGAKYGERVVVRHIQSPDVAGLQRARDRVDKGEEFATVAKELSSNRHTAPLGGALPAFTATATNVPDVFKQIAFALKEGEISDVVNSDNAYHLIKVEKRIPPTVVKYEDVKESLRAELMDRIVQSAVLQLRGKLQQQVQANLHIDNAALKAQYEKKRDLARQQQAEIDAAMKRDRAATAPGAADDAAAAPAADAQK